MRYKPNTTDVKLVELASPNARPIEWLRGCRQLRTTEVNELLRVADDFALSRFLRVRVLVLVSSMLDGATLRVAVTLPMAATEPVPMNVHTPSYHKEQGEEEKEDGTHELRCTAIRLTVQPIKLSALSRRRCLSFVQKCASLYSRSARPFRS